MAPVADRHEQRVEQCQQHKDGKQRDTMYPGKSSFHKHESEPPRTDVAIRRTPAEDFYVIMPAVELGTQTMSLEIHINPLVNWIWMGFGIMAFGTGIALLPESTFAFAMAKMPAEAATTALTILLSFGLVLGAARGVGQMTGDVATQPRTTPRTPERPNCTGSSAPAAAATSRSRSAARIRASRPTNCAGKSRP